MNLQRIWTRGAIYLVLLAFAASSLMPFYVMIITGLKPYPGRECDPDVGTADTESTLAVSLRAWTAVAPNFRNSVMHHGAGRPDLGDDRLDQWLHLCQVALSGMRIRSSFCSWSACSCPIRAS